MKSSEEIIRRAICLLIFADRCALEDKIFDGIRRSLEERENQRQTILGWLERKGYSVDLTSKEESIHWNQFLLHVRLYQKLKPKRIEK